MAADQICANPKCFSLKTDGLFFFFFFCSLALRAARALGGRAEEALRGYLRKRVLPEVGEREFVVVYMHSLVDRGDNFPGVGAIRSAYESLPAKAKERLRAVYFVHPGLQARLFFATFGRFLFSSGYDEILLWPGPDQ